MLPCHMSRSAEPYDTKVITESFTLWNQLRRTSFASWINILLPFVPAGIVLGLTKESSITFAINFVAIIPLAALGDISLGEIRLRVGDQYSGLLYMSTVNLVQLVGSILLLISRETRVLKVSILGSLLANLSLTLGLSILFSSLKNTQRFRHFNTFAAQVSGALLFLMFSALLVPTVFNYAVTQDLDSGDISWQKSYNAIVKISRCISVLLVFIYFGFLFLQFRTHRKVFNETPGQAEKTPSNHSRGKGGLIGLGVAVGIQASIVGLGDTSAQRFPAIKPGLPTYFPITSTNERKPKLHLVVAVTLFIITAGLLAACVEFTVQNIDNLISQTGVTETFVGLVLVPIPNCDVAPIMHALEEEFQKTIDLTVGKCLQTTLFVMPLCVMIGWGLNIEDMDMVFDVCFLSLLFATIFMLNISLKQGNFSWLQGAILLVAWAIVALTAWYYPDFQQYYVSQDSGDSFPIFKVDGTFVAR